MKRKVGYIVGLGVLTGLILAGCGQEKAEHQETAEQDQITAGDMVLDIEEKGFREEIAPPKPKGYFEMYEEYDGYRYYVLSGTAKNNGKKEINADAFFVQAEAGGRKADAKLRFLNVAESEFTEELPAGEERGYVLFMMVKTEEEPEGFMIYYDEGLPVLEDKRNFDREIIYEIDTES